MKALVLGGGSVKGCWQAGAIKAVLESGFEPEIITGISVGSANGVFIVNASGLQYKVKKEIDFKLIGKALYDFWLTKITSPKSIVHQKGLFKIAQTILSKKFNGLTDNAPFRKLLYKTVDMDNIYQSPLELYVGSVNMASGKIIYANKNTTDFMEYVLASTAIPIIMPVSRIGNRPYLDGGLRDSAPLREAIRHGATEIICITPHSRDMGALEINMGHFMQYAHRIMDIISNDNVNNDIDGVVAVNRAVSNHSNINGRYKYVQLKVIRPTLPVSINLSHFTSDDIHAKLEEGYMHAKKELQNGP